MASCIKGINALQGILSSRFHTSYPLAPLTSLKIGGMAEFFASIDNIGELQKVLNIAVNDGIRWRVLGKGTNLVIHDGLLKGIVVQLSGGFKKIRGYEDNRFYMGGGCPLSFLVKDAIKADLQGAEVISGIPGTLGGGIMMNAGTRLGSLGDLVEEVDILTKEGMMEKKKRQNMGFSYRGCQIGEDKIILGAEMRLKPGSDVRETVKAAIKKRHSTQPQGQKTAGCVFCNPEVDSAGRLIDEAGLKGCRCGQIEVSRKHGNFFVNLGGGTASEFLRLMEIVQNKVYQVFGIDLKPEVRIWAN
ncbi:UDP-N-acetylmuramate dehydrogenase [bacterium]|nr:UDP-N-acetylmuramate dehydrogenase [bacterium]